MSVGPTEILVILIVALLIFGPKQLPQMGRNLGRGMREFRRAAASARSELGLDEVTKEVNKVNEEVKSAVGELTAGADLTGAINEVKSSIDPKTYATVPKGPGKSSGGGAAAASPGAGTTAAPPDDAGASGAALAADDSVPVADAATGHASATDGSEAVAAQEPVAGGTDTAAEQEPQPAAPGT
jgi:sec-independent protein translocase protein TatA